MAQFNIENVVAKVKADKRYVDNTQTLDEAVVNGIIAYYIACDIDMDYYMYINCDDVFEDIERVKQAIVETV